MKNDSLKNIIIITLFFVFYIYFINAIDMFTSISDIKDDKYYIIENDQIPSIYNIIGKRKLYKYKYLLHYFKLNIKLIIYISILWKFYIYTILIHNIII